MPRAGPSRGTSRRLSLSTLAFPFRNYGFAVALGVIYWLMIWVFATHACDGSDRQYKTVGDILNQGSELPLVAGPFMLRRWPPRHNVMLGIMCLVLWVVLYVYADGAWGSKVRAGDGTLHWVAHIVDDDRSLFRASPWTSIVPRQLCLAAGQGQCCRSLELEVLAPTCASCSAPSSCSRSR